MIRALFGVIIRFLLWFFAFYLVMHVIRAIARALSSPGEQNRVKGEQPGSVQGRPAAKPADYKDIQDASFSEVDEN
jgi:flagellar biosynthesis/type III secretory pathway M-ring protein FliF/YscJ